MDSPASRRVTPIRFYLLLITGPFAKDLLVLSGEIRTLSPLTNFVMIAKVVESMFSSSPMVPIHLPFTESLKTLVVVLLDLLSQDPSLFWSTRMFPSFKSPSQTCQMRMGSVTSPIPSEKTRLKLLQIKLSSISCRTIQEKPMFTPTKRLWWSPSLTTKPVSRSWSTRDTSQDLDAACEPMSVSLPKTTVVTSSVSLDPPTMIRPMTG
mmetsp:Transcript_41940/g.101067  ORF Transcript_41940/g.101067 Transcript_41940/m.101067 type:complete len:208 (-) Transcript_41940:2407-3030(-)